MYPPDIYYANPTEYIELFKLDLTQNNGGVPLFVYFCNSVNPDGSAISYQSQEYIPIPCQATGYDVTSAGPASNPTLSIKNINAVFSPYLVQYDDCQDALVTRIKTFRRYLDGQSEAGSPNILGFDVHRISSLKGHNGIQITFELSSAIDIQQVTIPLLKATDTCQRIYRKYINGAFVAGTCDYAGSGTYDRYGNVTTPANDNCGKRSQDCSLRFGANNPLPMLGFPLIRQEPSN